ncbi:UxaA family hydrolase [Niastella sp. OAS944]|uniref:UxaA family hydrolase n=1 Tax=Niastella sp. OAS944 TaxID=2664089 RepID=UPI003475F4AA
MKKKVLKVHEDDNVVVALTNLSKGETVSLNGQEYTLLEDITAKHKFVATDLNAGDSIFMYGVLVGKAQSPIKKGGLISTANVKHAANDFVISDERKTNWKQPDVSKFAGRTFMGYHRANGEVGTANFWLVIPMVFCENRNLDVLQESLVRDLGYGRNKKYKYQAQQLIELYKTGKSVEDILNADIRSEAGDEQAKRLFPNVDGIKFLNHEGGCGGTRQDAQALCALLAGYITHPNCAGATVLSLGCQNAQVSILEEEIKKRDANFAKPLYILEQQKIGLESDLLAAAIKHTFAGLILANQTKREPAPLSKLCIGLECGGSDGFSGISANPAIGYTSDLLVGLGGSVILSEFPELCGVEQELSDRCVQVDIAKRFSHLMKTI